jgi:hypothetical protein
MISFDVEALFTSVPIEDALNIIGGRLRSDPDLETRTPLSVEQILDALKLVL